jgi:LmbE family N-acetylglucosaminyl deacetylase/ActR/RegA family two-component response regulator
MTDREPQPPTTLCRVLLVEDDDDQAALVVRWLETAGRYQVVRASNGHEGNALLRSRVWDLLISDIELPGITGLTLIRTSKELQPYTPTLLITAHGSLDYAVDALRGGADDFLLKPLTRVAFLDKVSGLADKGENERRKRRQIVLAIGAHPDDVEIGCGGILLRHRARGDDISVLTLSGGEQGGTAAERVQEAQRAAEILGARLFLGSLQDTAISEGTETIAFIEARIREVQPTVIYTHTLHDGHQDHRSVHRATVVASRTIPSLYCYQAPSSSIDFRPTKFLEIGDFIDKKLAAIAAYHSQIVKRPYLRESLLRATAEYWGRFAGYGMVEPLEVLRETT